MDVLVNNASNLEEKQTYGFKVVRLKWGGGCGDVTDRQAVVRTAGLEDGWQDGRKDKLTRRERNIQKGRETESMGVGDTRHYVHKKV